MVPAKARGVEVEQNGVRTICDIAVVPFTGPPAAHESMFVVTFEEVHQSKGKKAAKLRTRKPETLRETGRVAKLEHELAATKEYLQSLIEDHLRTNDDLNSANEELVSGNEELQSMNEELETAKEELQSINEELTTVNDELQSRNHEASQINSDLLNLMATVDIAILILDAEQRIRRFTPKARTILNVLPSDVGRALDDIRLNVDVPDLNHQIGEVIETNTMRDRRSRIAMDTGTGCRFAPARVSTRGSMGQPCRSSTSMR
jgi:two-component system CheB/CheR fusion protein